MTDDGWHVGQWLAVCDRCGFEFLSGQLALEWTGLRTCRGPGTTGCWEERHPQERLQGRKDRQAPPWTRPEQPDVFLTTRRWNDETKTWDEI